MVGERKHAIQFNTNTIRLHYADAGIITDKAPHDIRGGRTGILLLSPTGVPEANTFDQGPFISNAVLHLRRATGREAGSCT